MKLTDNQMQVIKESRAWLAEQPNKSLSPKTCDDYLKSGLRLIGNIEISDPSKDAAAVWRRASKTKSRNTWFREKASLKYVAWQSIKGLLKRQDKSQRAMRSNSEDSTLAIAFQKDILTLDFFLHMAKEIPPKPYTPQRRHSKRQDIKGLPDGWPLLVARECPDFSSAILVQSISGCRPAELASEVTLEIKGEQLIVSIRGAKITETAGQPRRIMTFQLNENSKPTLRVLAQEVARVGGRKTIKIDDPKSYSKSFSRAAARVFPGRRKTLTPYCLRHQFCADYKAEGHSAEEIAGALGHCATISQQFYGMANQGNSGGTGLVAVAVSRDIRDLSKPRTEQSGGPRI